jgi:uncharacterized protein (UPF0218 family)
MHPNRIRIILDIKTRRLLIDYRPAQQKPLIKLRNLPGYTSAPAYIYSDPVREEVKLPNTDHFFFPAK